MNNLKQALYLFLIFSTCVEAPGQLPEGYPDTRRKKQNINLNWKFAKDNESQRPTQTDFDDSSWETVSIPHNPDPVSLLIDQTTENWIQPTFMRDVSWYRKQIRIDLAGDEKAFIEFEGVHNKTELWINGQLAGRHDLGGYHPFHFDITPFVRSGEVHTLVIKADNTQDPTISPDPHRTDYLKFGGVYRDVYLVTTSRLHVNFNWEDFDAGVHITTPSVKKRNGTVSVKTTVVNEFDEDQKCHMTTKIVDADGYVLKTMESTAVIPAQGRHTYRQTTGITENFNLWSPGSPYLYRAVSFIYKDGQLVDFVDNRFGFRWFELVDGEGFLLNGEPFFMVGLNRHQNYPHIGDAVPNSLHYEEVLRFREAGINTIRLSHYPQDDAFIEACDELGILVFEEPATWIEWEEGEWMDKLAQSLRIIIRNHRNHPSIIIWGAGINHRGPVPVLQYVAKEEDPFRLTASPSSPWNGILDAGLTDIHATMDYRHTEWPDGDFCLVMEHGSSPNSESNQYFISRYKKSKNNIGTLAWVGADYNHLQPEWRPREKLTDYGILTAYRHKRPTYYWYQSELTAKPFVHIANETASKDGKIRVFSNAPKVALYANEQLIAIQSPDNRDEKRYIDHPSFTFHHPWTNETLRAVAMNRGETVATHTRSTAGASFGLKVAVDYPDIALISGGSDIKMIRAYIVDKAGEVVTNATNKIHFEINGAGQLVYGDKPYMNEVAPMEGVATVYVRGTSSPGTISIKATSPELRSGSLQLTTVINNTNETEKAAKAIYDHPIHRLDIGGKKQFVEFDWKAWTLTDPSNITYTTDDQIRFSLAADSTIIWSKGEPVMMGNLSFMGADGAYVFDSPLGLSISGLKAGTYRLETFHHAREHEEQFPYSMAVEIKSAVQNDAFVSDHHIIDHYEVKNTRERAPLSVVSMLDSNGKDDVRVIFKTDKEKAYTWLNGLMIRRIK